MRISDWSSDVCSSDLRSPRGARRLGGYRACGAGALEDELEQRQPLRHAAGDVELRAGAGARAKADAAPWQLGVPFPLLHVRFARVKARRRSEEHTSELQSLMRISYAVFCLKKKKTNTNH